MRTKLFDSTRQALKLYNFLRQSIVNYVLIANRGSEQHRSMRFDVFNGWCNDTELGDDTCIILD